MKNRYYELRKYFDTGDFLNCITPFVWWNPRSWFWRAIGHTAKIYKDQDTGQIFVLESTTLNGPSGRNGVQLTPMSEWMKNTHYEVYWRKLHFHKSFKDLYRHRAASWIKEYRNTKYPDLSTWWGKLFLMRAAIDTPLSKENPDIDFVMFCTHMAGHFDRFCGIWDGNPAELQPDDTRNGGKYFNTTKNCHYAIEMRIK